MRLMTAALLMACAVSASAQAPSSPSDTDFIRKQIETHQQAIGKAIGTRDYAALDRYWAPEMLVNSPDNTILTREQVIAAMGRGGLNYSSLKTTVESFRVFGDVAVEMGHEDFTMATGPAAGKPLQRRYTNVWKNTGDHWIQIARQATILNVEASAVYGH